MLRSIQLMSSRRTGSEEALRDLLVRPDTGPQRPHILIGGLGMGFTLRALRLSQTDLGKEIGVSFPQLQKYENGKNRVGASRLAAIAKALGVPVGYFFPEILERFLDTFRRAGIQDCGRSLPLQLGMAPTSWPLPPGGEAVIRRPMRLRGPASPPAKRDLRPEYAIRGAAWGFCRPMRERHARRPQSCRQCRQPPLLPQLQAQECDCFFVRADGPARACNCRCALGGRRRTLVQTFSRPFLSYFLEPIFPPIFPFSHLTFCRSFKGSAAELRHRLYARIGLPRLERKSSRA